METTAAAIVDADCEQSPTIGALAKALAAAQAEMENATKDSDNPFFKSKYADLASVRDAAKPIYKHGLAVVQQVLTRPNAVGVRTVLMHESGEWMASRMFVAPEKPGPQAAGSVITYLRRYMLTAMLGIAQEDDDANAGSMRPTSPPPRQQPSNEPPARNGKPEMKPAANDDLITPGQLDDLTKLFASLGYTKPAASTEREAVTGKKSTLELTKADAEKLIAHLKGKLETRGAAS